MRDVADLSVGFDQLGHLLHLLFDLLFPVGEARDKSVSGSADLKIRESV